MGAFADAVQSIDAAVREHLDGVSVLYAPSSGAPVTVSGMFDANYTSVDPQEPGVSTVGPALFLRLNELPNDPGGDEELRVTVNAKQYRAHTVKPDTMGGVVLLLNRVD